MLIAMLLLTAPVAQAAEAAPAAPTGEQCGWLIADGAGLREQPDTALHPADPAPLPVAPEGAKAAYCARDAIGTQAGDQRLLQLGLPLVVRAGGREGVLELPPAATFDYHKDGEQYLPGRPPTPKPPTRAPVTKPPVKKPAPKKAPARKP